MNKFLIKLLFLVSVLLIFFLAYRYNVISNLNLENLKEKRALFKSLYQENPFKITFIFSLIYIFSVAASLPVGAILTLSGGAIFGTFHGSIIVVLIYSLGSTFTLVSLAGMNLNSFSNLTFNIVKNAIILSSF